MSDGREGGFIKLHRRIQSWPLWQSMTALQRMVWIEILMSANWKDGEFWYGSTRIPVLRGQLAHSEAEIAERAQVGRKVVRATIEKLLNEGAIGREKAPIEGQAPFIITIRNYEKYQGNDDSEGPVEGQDRAKRGPSEGQGRALREEGEEGEEGKKDQIPPTPQAPEPVPLHRPARWGVGHPAYEAGEHWLRTVWPRLSEAPPAPLTTPQAQQLAQLSGRVGPAEVKARMDRAAADPWWAGKLTLDSFLAQAERFAARRAGADPPVKAKVTAAASNHNEFTGGRREI